MDEDREGDLSWLGPGKAKVSSLRNRLVVLFPEFVTRGGVSGDQNCSCRNMWLKDLCVKNVEWQGTIRMVECTHGWDRMGAPG